MRENATGDHASIKNDPTPIPWSNVLARRKETLEELTFEFPIHLQKRKILFDEKI